MAAQYGFTNGSNSVTVTALNNQPGPSGLATCYTVTVTKPVPLYLAQILGFTGNTTLGGKKAENLQASATASQGTQSVSLCLLALGTTGTALTTHGAPKADMAGCSVMSNSNATCNGHNLGANYGLAHGSDNGCGVTQESNVPQVSDPYAYLASNIPQTSLSSCGGAFPGATPTGNTINVSATSAPICGNLTINGTITINDPTGAPLIIENGNLVVNGTLQTASGSSVAIVFSGTNGGSYSHIPAGNGTYDIQAPTSGTWSGVAMYQDPNLSDSNGGLDVSYSGNSPTWNISGLVYLPNSNVTFSGAVGKSSNGSNCFALVVQTLLINGTADMTSGSCAAAGLNMPTGQIPGRGQLVQ